jgi:hypothetical protein
MLNPASFAVFWRSAIKTWEIALAAPQVVTYRMGGMAGDFANVRNQKELFRMGQEKVEAFLESWLAMAMQAQTFNTQWASAMFRQTLAGWAALAALATTGTTQQATRAQTALLRSMIIAGNNPKVTAPLAKVVARGLHPVHRRATSNVKRLSRPRKRR